MSEPEGQRYYRAMVGTWRGRVRVTITDHAALAAASLSWLDRLTWRMTATMARVLGPPLLETSVAYDGSGDVTHTTRMRQLGMTLVSGTETITLGGDGRSFVLRGAHRFASVPWRARAVAGTGEIDRDADGARYTIDYLGTSITQTTRRDGEHGLVITQTTPFSRAEVRLERLR